jgi:hypothetical protein
MRGQPPKKRNVRDNEFGAANTFIHLSHKSKELQQTNRARPPSTASTNQKQAKPAERRARLTRRTPALCAANHPA